MTGREPPERRDPRGNARRNPRGDASASLCLWSCLFASGIAFSGRAAAGDPGPGGERAPGPGAPAAISGELRAWHKVTLTFAGPSARELDDDPNPFADYRLEVLFAHADGPPSYTVPGYFAADGRAAETSADSGSSWRVHFAPDRPGRWSYRVSFVAGRGVALDRSLPGRPIAGLDGAAGTFEVLPTDKSGRDFRARGRLEHAGGRYLRFAGTGERFLKAGPDSPENLLAYFDFDGTVPAKTRGARAAEASSAGLHRFEPHVRDWREGDPVWGGGKGKGLLGALRYLSEKGCDAVSFLTYNAGGDGDDVWPFVARDDKRHYDCSKLDQWQIAFDRAEELGLLLHVKLQETENDDERVGPAPRAVPEALDGGRLGPERKLYLRELVARFAHALALEWNLGEENTQTQEEQRAMARYLRDLDPYDHPIVLHTYPNWQDRVYGPHLGEGSILTGVSIQGSWRASHRIVRHWVQASREAGKPWVVAMDEQNPASSGVPPDPGHAGFAGRAKDGTSLYDLHDIRRCVLWGTLLAGGAGVQYYFGYDLPENDLRCEDWRSRDRSWDYARIALDFFREERIPFWDMASADGLVGNPDGENTVYCFAKRGELYLVYLVRGGEAEIDLSGAEGRFELSWFDPRRGGPLASAAPRELRGGGKARLGPPPREPGEDWLAVVRR